MRHMVLALVGSMLLAGCGALEVEMSVLNPAYTAQVESQAELRSLLKEALYETDEDVRERYEDLYNVHRRVYEELAKAYEAEAASLPPGVKKDGLGFIASSLLPDFDDSVKAKYEETVNSVLTANRGIRREFAGLNLKQTDTGLLVSREKQANVLTGSSKSTEYKFIISGRLELLLLEKLALVREFRSEIVRDSEGEIRDFDGDSVAGVATDIIENEERFVEATGQLFSERIVGSPLAYAVASAPDSQWDAVFNRAFGKGKLGNVNVAIKLGKESDVFGQDFTVKGLTFDPSAVADVAAKVTTQSLLIAAQISGVPVSGAQAAAEDGSGSLLTTSTSLAQMRAKNARRDAAFSNAEAALAEIADVLLSEADNMSSGKSPSERKDAVEAFRVVFDAQKTRLNVSDID